MDNPLQKLFIVADLILCSLLDLAVRVDLQEMLVEDAVFGQLLVIRNLVIPDLLQLHQLEAEHGHFFH